MNNAQDDETHQHAEHLDQDPIYVGPDGPAPRPAPHPRHAVKHNDLENAGRGWGAGQCNG